ncbi:SprT-like domain-containing protein [Bacillus sp. N9]
MIDMRVMKARWGSALVESNTILLNSELIKAPKHCIEYVILHEMIHFKYNNHSDSFYNMLYALMPDWEKRKAILDEEIVKEL